MPFKAPSFWQHNGWPALALAPFSFLYTAVACLIRKFSRPYKSSLPVLCIGNAVAGGSGKTPVVQAIVKLVKDRGIYQNPVILMRGYGGVLKGPTFVDPVRHDFRDVGDEALLHVRVAPVIVSRNRADGARLAEASGADLIIMDDGLQNFSLAKDWSFLVIDGIQKWGNGRVFPAGPLREPLKKALGRCVGVIGTGGFSEHVQNKPVIVTTLQAEKKTDQYKIYYAFAGLGRPEKFRQTLVENGYTLSGFRAFPDHHPYTEDDMETLFNDARGSLLITTEKDAVRIPEQYKHRIDVLKVVSTFDDPDAFLSLWITP